LPLNLAAEWSTKVARASELALARLRALPHPATYQARLKADYAGRQREIVRLRQWSIDALAGRDVRPLEDQVIEMGHARHHHVQRGHLPPECPIQLPG